MSQPCLPVRRNKNKREREVEQQSASAEGGFDDFHTMDGAEYLARVVKQAKAMPEVFVAPEVDDNAKIPDSLRNYVPIDGSAASLSYLISGRASLTAPPTKDHLPRNPAWIESTITNFEKLRTYLETCKAQGIGGKMTERIPFPTMKDRSGWHIFCVGSDEARGNSGSYFGDDDNEEDGKTAAEEIPEWQKGIPEKGYGPSVRILCQIDQVLVRKVLAHLSHYIRDGWSPFTPQRSAWIYALLARLEKPVHRDDAAVLFGLLKVLTLARSKLTVEDSARSKLAVLNVPIVLIGVYFGQGGGDAMMYKEG